MCIVIVCLPDCDVINFEINLIFLIELFHYTSKSQYKNLNILRTKRAIKELSFKQKKTIFLEGKSQTLKTQFIKLFLLV